MHTLSSKLATLAVALMINGLMIGGIAYLFDIQLQQHASAIIEAAV